MPKFEKFIWQVLTFIFWESHSVKDFQYMPVKFASFIFLNIVSLLEGKVLFHEKFNESMNEGKTVKMHSASMKLIICNSIYLSFIPVCQRTATISFGWVMNNEKTPLIFMKSSFSKELKLYEQYLRHFSYARILFQSKKVTFF